MFKRKSFYKKTALALSLCMIAIWIVMGTGASLAWFTDKSEELKNVFHCAEFDLVVSYKNDNMDDYEEIVADTTIFNEKALYEPGYTQVVYLRVENNGSVPFDFKTAVSVTDYTLATNVYGVKFNLQDYLMFGVVTAENEAQLLAKVGNRENAKTFATEPLSNYSTEIAELSENGEAYIAIVVYMPEAAANEANYRGDDKPKVELGVIVEATQKRK